ncbi:hypothetical protein PHYBOEH_000247 [Phytophthora boehmeriae]|uniref:Cilia- and flagella-associated protein 157 n=1 Tax=Phytophthora boehmeriae TaxID=109152 RepID=A0A8T1VGW6_9STRA|nr:hypothetical protein PHYBOEH_000247 [Phytophthora boehmeriae]
MDAITDPNASQVSGLNSVGGNGGVDRQVVSTPLTHSIMSSAVMSAIDHTDPKLAFDMMLVNEHLTSQDMANRSLKEEAALLKNTLAKQTVEQHEMFQYFHEKTDSNVARIAELEKALSDAQEEIERLLTTSQEQVEKDQRERAAEMANAQTELRSLKDELHQVHAFAAAKKEIEAHTRELETKLDAQRAVFQTQVQELERNNLVEQARMKQELLGRMQDAKAELMMRTHDQVASTTHRTLLENEHFTKELAFQSRETEKLLERLDDAQQQVAALRTQNKVFEENERLMAKKNRYYQKILARLQSKSSDGDTTFQFQLDSPKASDVKKKSILTPLQEEVLSPQDDDTLLESLQVALEEEKHKSSTLETQLQRATEWIRVFQRERQFLLVEQDEVIQFLHRAIDEAVLARQQTAGELHVKKAASNRANGDEFASSHNLNTRVEELLALIPTTSTMEVLGRRVLVPRPALDDLSSTDAHEVLLFFLEKLHHYQERIGAVYPMSRAVPSPIKAQRELLERQLGVELPPISTNNSSHSPSPLKQKRRMFAHVSAAVDAGNSQWLTSPKIKPVVNSQPQAPLSPQLLAMATNQFNFLSPTVTQRSPTKKRSHQPHHSSLNKNTVVSPPRKTQIQTSMQQSSSYEGLTPWPGTSSAASIPDWNGSATQ